MNELTVENREKTALEVKAGLDLILQVMKATMEKGVDFGVIPGCGEKPTLFKPGSEKILTAFRIGVEPIVEDMSTQDEARYRVKTRLFHEPTGVELGCGIGEASSYEEKYKWRRPVCDKEYEDAPEDRRRLKYQRDGSTWKQVRTNKADVSNTVLKMAKKRSQIDGTLTATAASAVFAQDLEDMETEIREAIVAGDQGGSAKPVPPPQPKSQTPKPDVPKSEPNPEGYGFVPQAISKKEGVGSKGPWVKFGIKDEQGAWFGTFDEELGELATQAKEQKRQVEITYESDGKYNNIKTLVLA